MMLGATGFGGAVCNSSADICASDDFERIGVTPAPSISRLKSRRFIIVPFDSIWRSTCDGATQVGPVREYGIEHSLREP